MADIRFTGTDKGFSLGRSGKQMIIIKVSNGPKPSEKTTTGNTK